MSPLSGELWPAHPKPLPDELLTSWIARCAKANGLKLQTFCDRVFGKERQLWNRDIDRLAPKWLLTEMSRCTGTPIDAVRRTTLDIYRGRLFRERHAAGQLRWILPLGIHHRTRRRFGLQFCPQCLAEDRDPHFRLHWRVALLTYCQKHHLHLHDRCPACKSPVIFHRRELGRPDVTDQGLLCLCHACNFDLRNVKSKSFVPYEASISGVLTALADYISGTPVSFSMGHADVLHQLCKVMISPRKASSLAAFIANAIDAEFLTIPHAHRSFESYSVEHRDAIIQLAAWLMAAPESRLTAAWRAKAVRYNHLAREFPSPPAWYLDIISEFVRSDTRRQACDDATWDSARNVGKRTT